MIVAAAIEIGFEHFTMASVAERLGVSISALYRHVADREALNRLITDSWMSGFQAPADHGQHWAELARDLAHLLFDTFLENPALFVEQARGRFSAVATAQTTETFLRRLVVRDFAAEEALALALDIRSAALGAALVAAGARAWEANGTGPDAVFEAHAVPELPVLRTVRASFESGLGRSSWQPTIGRILAFWAEQRGETLPPDVFETESEARGGTFLPPN